MLGAECFLRYFYLPVRLRSVKPENHNMNIHHHENLKTHNPEDGGRKFFQNVDTHLPDYIVL